MKKFLQELAFVLLVLTGLFPVAGQDLSGYWQGMDYGPRPNEVTFWPTTLKLAQTGNTINGNCFQQVTSQTPYFVEWKISGASVNTNVGQMQFAEITALNVAESAPCASKYSFTYYPDEERLLGMREFECGMKLTMDLYRMRLKSRDTYCKGETATLEVTGKDIKWYADPQKSKRLHTGNTYETKVTQTDTFYVTQIFHAVETPPVPVIIKLSEPSITNVQVTHTSCDQDNGIISVTAAGDGPMTYSLDNGMFQSVSVFPNLYAKTYQLTVKSGTGCPVSREVTVEKRTRPTFLTVTTNNPCTSETGGVYAQAQGGYGKLTYALDEQPFRESGVFSDLQSGEYTLRVRDSLGCETTMVVKVADKNNAVVLQDVDVQHGRCGAEFGSVTVIATGTGELQYSLDGENYVTTPNFPRVIPGTYEVFVKDPGGCAASRKIFVGTAPAPKFLNIIEYNASCNGNDGAISIYATGRGPLLFSIDAVNYVPDTVFTGLSPLVQTVYMVDTAGCYVARSLYIREDCLESVHIPTAFSPDLDGKNEVMELKFATGKLKIRHFRLFNRWGTVVASRSDQTVESGYALWDGLYKGDRVQPGAYPYELMIEFDDGRTRMIRDSIMLLR